MTPVDSAVGGDRRLPRLHVVTDDEVIASEGWLERAGLVLETGGPQLALHLRGPDTDPRTLLALADALLPGARRAGAVLVVNDRIDVALAADLDGVHLGGASLPPRPARAILGADRWIGVSCHGTREVGVALDGGADLVFLGTIHRTPSHPGLEGMGTRGVEEAVGRAGGAPLIAIGGIAPADVAAVVAAGAHGVAVIRGVWTARDPTRAVTEYLEVLGE